MLNLSSNELKLIAKSRGIKGYKSMSEDRLSRALNAWESVKESETLSDPTKINTTIRQIRRENRDEDKILTDLRFFHDRANKNKIMREIKKENRDKDKILRELRFLLYLEKDHYKPIKTDSAFNNNYIQYESIGDEDKNLSIQEYIDTIRPYLSDIIDNQKTQVEWKINLTIAITFISSKNSNETRIVHSESDNIEIMMSSKTDEIIEELFESLLQRY